MVQIYACKTYRHYTISFSNLSLVKYGAQERDRFGVTNCMLLRMLHTEKYVLRQLKYSSLNVHFIACQLFHGSLISNHLWLLSYTCYAEKIPLNDLLTMGQWVLAK